MVTNIKEKVLKVYSEIPKKWGNTTGYQYSKNHNKDGWRDIIISSYDSETHQLGTVIYDKDTDTVTYEVVDKPVELIQTIAKANAVALQEQALNDKIKQNIQTAAQTESGANPAIYPFFTELIGETLSKDFKLQALDNDNKMVLWKTLQSVEVTDIYPPRTSVSLYAVSWKDDEIPVFVPYQQSQYAYTKGEEVWFPTKQDSIYKSLIDNNSYSPADYPTGWEKQ